MFLFIEREREREIPAAEVMGNGESYIAHPSAKTHGTQDGTIKHYIYIYIYREREMYAK